ncbi:hypothetical protein [Pseudomonas sp. 2FE]|uniref:hypothetical protein n=1 Tax=Pseudomonas sp. 2FE TaxID=2502190 RepID=UPI0010F9054C|nr:hypothetical protein [Pseudomonas sp. 2FE]
MSTQPIKIYIDSCAVNVLHEHSVNLAAEFPKANYELIITKGVQQELQDIPEHKPVKEFALSLVADQRISEASFFGFRDAKNPENNLRYTSGFGSGILATSEQMKFLEETQENLGTPRKSKLRNNETDRDLLALGLGSVILTKENKVGGALKAEAEKSGTIIINIAKWPSSEISLNEYVELAIEKSVGAQI